ncbi:MAG: hypothetical protein IE909_01120 [Campylobacterales bacterium]|nr:hypothetical protein [Campylobacterales bacterium]
MLIIGDALIPFTPIYTINSIDQIKHTSANSVVCFKFDKTIMRYCLDNSVNYCVKVESLLQTAIANNLRARYIIVDRSIAKQVQMVAENYMYDCKILVEISDENQIEPYLLDGIDGVIYSHLLVSLQDN